MTIASQERSPSSRLPYVAAALIALTLALSVLLRLSAYGIWDPWELTVADAARKIGEGAEGEAPKSLTLWLVNASFALFGMREWAGRLPMALSGVALLVVLGLWVRRFAGTRAALYSALVLGTTPLFLLHSREMVGATPSFLFATLTTVGATNALFTGRSGPESAAKSGLWLGLALVAGVLGAYAAGVLVATLPGLLAAAATALLTESYRDERRERRLMSWVVVGAAFVVGALVLRTVFRHGSDYSVWTGGAPLDAAVPTYEHVVSHLFHGFAPWSAAAPVAVGVLLWREGSVAVADAPLRLVCLLWASFAYAATTIFLSSYGAAPYPAGAALAVAVALWLARTEESDASFWPELVIVLLMLGLIVRDFALYPASPFEPLELANAQPPEKFNPKIAWAAVFGAFGAALALSCIATRERGALELRAPYRGILALWKKGGGHQGWIVFAGLVLLGLVLFGVLSLVSIPGVKLSSIARRIGRAAGAAALLTPVAVALAQTLYHYASKLSGARNALVIVAALACGIYTSQAFLPKLSAHLSPREVFDQFAKLAKPNEPLAQHQVHGRAAAYYVARDVQDIANEADLVNFLAQPGRRWALLPSERFADIDVAFRRRMNRHLFVPGVENARVSLVASEPLEGRPNENPLSKYVVREPPAVQTRVGANFENRIELIGYNLELPHDGWVGAGQSFTVVWVYRVISGNIGAFQAFLHVDAEGQRINGDHDPVDGMYPVRLWDTGDVIIDRQKVSVPATTPPGPYTMYTGFFRGEQRMKVLSGPKDDSDRVTAGVIQIR
jgi:4-amino-4-deoxy-L-arabinose transferase-like glycosyltransferase